jgi:hypothetical protein
MLKMQRKPKDNRECKKSRWKGRKHAGTITKCRNHAQRMRRDEHDKERAGK